MKAPLETWSDDTIVSFVNAFIDEKFPTIIALNKIDNFDSAKNIQKIVRKYPDSPIVLTSAIAEIFLRKLNKQKFIRYRAGADYIDTRESLIEDGDPTGGGLREMDDKLKTRVENLLDLILYRHGTTGVVNILKRAAEVLGLVPAYPVRNIHTFGNSDGDEVFRDCVLMSKGSTVADLARKIMGDAPIAYAETVGSIKVSEDDVIEVGRNDVSFPKMQSVHMSDVKLWLIIYLYLALGYIFQSRTDLKIIL